MIKRVTISQFDKHSKHPVQSSIKIKQIILHKHLKNIHTQLF